jgi:hypothetical protein
MYIPSAFVYTVEVEGGAHQFRLRSYKDDFFIVSSFSQFVNGISVFSAGERITLIPASQANKKPPPAAWRHRETGAAPPKRRRKNGARIGEK